MFCSEYQTITICVMYHFQNLLVLIEVISQQVIC
jgi:hypothetical protein